MKEEPKRRNIRLVIILTAFFIILCFMGSTMLYMKQENRQIQERLEREIQQGISKNVFRLHVIANSDKETDQKLKLKVKTGVVEYLKTVVGENSTLENTKEAVLTHLPEIEEKAEEIVQKQGFDYPVRAVVERTYFPDKTYGDCTFPAGEYEALNVRIGEAAGRNWWCVLYPSLCFLNDTYAVVTREKKEELKSILTEEEFQEILQNPQEKRKVRIGFRWF